ncbi:MAG: hypothetical protein GF401_08375 [Chitinivibrionales bacterium]|nr:hypothetical protein [Chitinivibrionales bacterium]
MMKNAAKILLWGFAVSLCTLGQDSICTYLWKDCDLDTCFNRTQLVDGQPLRVPENVTRISRDGLRLCLDAVALDAPVDLIFVVDLSGSMNPTRYGNNDVICHGGLQNQTGDSYTIAPYQYDSLSIPFDNSNCEWAGDPYGQRAIAVQAGISRLYTSHAASQSTAGYIGFNDNIESNHSFPPILLDEIGKSQFDQDVVNTLEQWVNDRNGGTTDYREALDRAIEWLQNSSLTPNKNKAVIFISDGRPCCPDNDESVSPTDTQRMFFRSNNIPVYGIFLGGGDAGGALNDLAEYSNGAYIAISPESTQTLLPTIVDSIVGEISQGYAAQTVSVKNISTGQSAADSDSIYVISETEFQIFLDSVIELHPGNNQIAIDAHFSSPTQSVDDTTISFNITIAVEGAADPSCVTYTCHPASELEILNDSLSQQDTRYTLRLTTYATELSEAYITVTSRNKGDREENIRLTNPSMRVDNSGNGYLIFETTVSFISSNTGFSTPNNGITEARLTDTLDAEWKHPRDPRDRALTIKYVRSLPSQLRIDSLLSSPGGYPEYPSLVLWPAGDSIPLFSKIFADNRILQDYQSSPLDSSIKWEFRDITTGIAGDSSIGYLTDSTGFETWFYPKQARKTILVKAQLERPDLPREFQDLTRDSILVYIEPGPPAQLVIEGTSDSSATNLYDPTRSSEIDVIEIDPNSRIDSACAVLRDREGNYIGPSTNTAWPSSNTDIITARNGDESAGQGFMEKSVQDSGRAAVSATSGRYSNLTDSVLVISRKYSIIALKILAGDGKVEVDTLRMTTNDDTTLHVQGLRSDNGMWEDVTADWSVSSSTAGTDPKSPSGSSSWTFSPSDTGSGWIKTERSGATSDSILVEFTPGNPTQVEIEIINPKIDSMRAGKEITAVVRLRNENGPVPGLYCYPEHADGRLVVYQEILGRGGGTKPAPVSIVKDTTSLLNQRPDAGIQSPECFIDGIDTVKFVLYYAPSDPDSLNQLIVGLHGLEAKTPKFRVYPDELDSLVIFNGETAKPVEDTLRLDAGDYRFFKAGLYDRFGNTIDCRNDSIIWSSEAQVPQITDSTACWIHFKTTEIQHDTRGSVCLHSAKDSTITDCVHLIVTAPDAALISASTRDYDADGYIDGIVCTYDKKVDTTGFSIHDITIMHNQNVFTVSDIHLIEKNVILIGITEEETAAPQTGWTPAITIVNLKEAQDVFNVTAADRVSPVIWKVVKEIKDYNDRSRDIVTVTFSEDLDDIPGGRDSPFESFHVWYQNNSTTTEVDTMLKGVDFFLVSQDEKRAKFQMRNGNDLNVDHLLSIHAGGKFRFTDKHSNTQRDKNNRRVNVELQGLELRVRAGPNPFRPIATPRFLAEDHKLRAYHSKEVAQFVYNHGGIAFIIDIPIPSNQKNREYMTITGALKIYDITGNLVYSRENLDNLMPEEWQNPDSWRGDKQLGLRWLGVNDRAVKVAPGAYRAVIRLHIAYPDAYDTEQRIELLEQISLGIQR